MKYSLILTAAVAMAVACNSPSADDAAVAIEEPAALLPEVTEPQQELVTDSIAAPAPTVVTAAPAAGGRVNPPHGEPGHDCAVAVGAPLPDKNAPAGAQVQTAPQTSVNIPPSGPPATSVMTAPAQTGTTPPTGPGLNPPHGQPGHDCAIPVGAPLKK